MCNRGFSPASARNSSLFFLRSHVSRSVSPTTTSQIQARKKRRGVSPVPQGWGGCAALCLPATGWARCAALLARPRVLVLALGTWRGCGALCCPLRDAPSMPAGSLQRSGLRAEGEEGGFTRCCCTSQPRLCPAFPPSTFTYGALLKVPPNPL